MCRMGRRHDHPASIIRPDIGPTGKNRPSMDERGALTDTPFGAGNWDGGCGGTRRCGVD